MSHCDELSSLSSNMSAMSVQADSPQPAIDNKVGCLKWQISNADIILKRFAPRRCLKKIFDMVGVTWTVKFYPRGIRPNATGEQHSSITISPMCLLGSVGPTTTQADFDKTIGSTLGKFCVTLEMDGWNCILKSDESEPFPAVVGERVCFDEFVSPTELNDCKGDNDSFLITLSMKSVN